MPFSLEQFLGVFEKYNLAVFPMQAVAYALGLVAIVLVVKNRAGRIVPAILSFLWLWNGIVYHGIFFSPTNNAAFGFAALFVVQGLLFAWTALFRTKLSFQYRAGGPLVAVAFAAIGYAVVVYPALGMLFGHAYPRAPMFGIAPCPTTIFTFGLLLLAAPRMPRYLVICPLAWSFIGIGAALSFGIYEDIGLLFTGVLATVLILFKERAVRRTARGALRSEAAAA